MKKKRRPSPAPALNSKRQKIVESVLSQVPFDGWTDVTYVAGVKQSGGTRTEADRLLPNGIRDVVEQYGLMADEAMQARIEAESGFARFRTRDKIAFAVRARLEFFVPQREAVRQLMMWYALPLNFPRGVRRIARTADLMWVAAGDTSTDYNFYTKRVLLAVVFKATILFWLDDETPECRATWEFLDRRIGEVLKLGKSLSLLKEFTPSEIGDFVRKKMK